MTSFTPRAAALLACSFIVVLVTACGSGSDPEPTVKSCQAPLRPHPRPPHRANRFFRRVHTERRS